MFAKRSNIKMLAAVAMFGASSLITAIPAVAQSSLADVLAAVRRDSDELTRENQQRLNEFKRAADAQEASMGSLRRELNAAEGEGQRLQAEFDQNQRLIEEKSSDLEAQAGDFGQLLGQFRQAAQESMPVIRNSLASAEYPGRADRLAEIAQARTLPTRSDLDELPRAILLEMIAQSEVKTFQAEVDQIGSDGGTLVKDVFRIGVFNAMTADEKRFVKMSDGNLAAFEKNPPASLANSMAKLMNSNGDVVLAPVDPSKGALFDIYGKMPSLMERYHFGGPVGYVITALGLFGIALGLFKLITISMTAGSMRATARTKEAGNSNPLARVFAVFEKHRKENMETLEMKLDEQILKESPGIERFNDIIKVLAAVAPLLGLLGTVMGMIKTFTAITIYGAGDPQIMAGGISEALMTTVFGLFAAIPLLLIHAVCAAASRSAAQILDEQAVGLIAERAEKEGVAA